MTDVGLILLGVVFLVVGVVCLTLTFKDSNPWWVPPAVYSFVMSACLLLVGIVGSTPA